VQAKGQLVEERKMKKKQRLREDKSEQCKTGRLQKLQGTVRPILKPTKMAERYF
jgi:hypothetical protein